LISAFTPPLASPLPLVSVFFSDSELDPESEPPFLGSGFLGSGFFASVLVSVFPLASVFPFASTFTSVFPDPLASVFPLGSGFLASPESESEAEPDESAFLASVFPFGSGFLASVFPLGSGFLASVFPFASTFTSAFPDPFPSVFPLGSGFLGSGFFPLSPESADPESADPDSEPFLALPLGSGFLASGFLASVFGEFLGSVFPFPVSGFLGSSEVEASVEDLDSSPPFLALVLGSGFLASGFLGSAFLNRF